MRQIAVLGGTVALMSAVMKNIGALAILMPVAMQLARRHKTSAHLVLMPMSFCALMGGLITLIGTSPNIIVARVRAEMTGQPFGMFDYAPVGLALTAAALLFLVVGWRLLPRARVGTRSAEETFAVETYASEMRLPADSSYVGRTVGELEAVAGGEATVIGIIRERFRRYAPDVHWTLLAEDVLVLQGDAPALQRLVRGAGLYHFRAVATNSSGTAHGRDRTFRTPRVARPTGVVIGAHPNPVTFGHAASVSGQVQGQAAGGVTVALESQPSPFTAPFVPAAPSTTTDGAGRYSFQVFPGVTTNYRAATGGVLSPCSALVCGSPPFPGESSPRARRSAGASDRTGDPRSGRRRGRSAEARTNRALPNRRPGTAARRSSPSRRPGPLQVHARPARLTLSRPAARRTRRRQPSGRQEP